MSTLEMNRPSEPSSEEESARHRQTQISWYHSTAIIFRAACTKSKWCCCVISRSPLVCKRCVEVPWSLDFSIMELVSRWSHCSPEHSACKQTMFDTKYTTIHDHEQRLRLIAASWQL